MTPRLCPVGLPRHRPLSHALPLLLLLRASLWLASPGLASGQGSTEADVLMQIKASLGGSTTAAWAGSDPCGLQGGATWPGIKCSQTSPPSIVALDLEATDAVGSIPTSLFLLHNLTYLDLGGNEGISGPIPDNFTSMLSLQYMDMHLCSLSGSLPGSLTALSNLTFLGLNNNNLSGPIPAAIGNARGLWWLDLSTNRISGGLPESLSRCMGLGHLHLSYNQLNFLPDSLTAMTSLVHLMLDQNQFNQTFPTGFSTLPFLQNIRMSHNSWTIPDITAILPRTISEFYASSAFAAPMPVPDFPLVAPRLQIIEMAGNGMTGSVPASLTALRELNSITLRGNRLSGAVPVFLSAVQTQLQLVDLQNNSITAVPLQDVSQPNGAFQIYVAGNPACIKSQLSVCQFNSTIPEWANDTYAGLCPELWCPPVPPTNAGAFIGPDPTAFDATLTCSCASPGVYTMRLNTPTFTFFSAELGASLQGLLLQHLQSRGVRGIQSTGQIIVSKVEQLVGQEIPFYVTLLFFGAEGGAVDYAALKSTLHADRLFLEQPFGLQSSYAWADPVPLNATEAPSGSWSLSTGAIVGIAVGSAAAVALLIALVAWFFVRRKKYQVAQDDWDESDYKALDGIRAEGVRRFRLPELKKATRDFSTLLGEGAYGQVYSGSLAPGLQVAVKRARPIVHQGGEAFRTEIELLSRVRQRNLVQLLGFCREEGEQLLVYEFVARGTLHEWLHDTSETRLLSWRERLVVAEGAARGFAYLHDEIQPSIVHRDIKPGNILLTEKMEAKVADFGLSKVVTDEIGPEGVGVNTRVAGTVGYLDPEYTLSGFLTKESDVYSFGIVLLELATGRRCNQDYTYIRVWVAETVNREGIDAALDPRLQALPEQEQPSPVLFEAFLRLGMHCCALKARLRPSMRTVASTLTKIRTASGATIEEDSGARVLRGESVGASLNASLPSIEVEHRSFVASEHALSLTEELSDAEAWTQTTGGSQSGIMGKLSS